MSWFETRRDALLRRWLDGDLTSTEAEQLRTLREQDPELDAEAARLMRQVRLLGGAPEHAPPADLTARIMQEVGSAGPPSRLHAFLFRPRTLTYRLATGFAAVAAVAAVVLLVYRLGVRDGTGEGTEPTSPGPSASQHGASPDDAPGPSRQPARERNALVIELALESATHVEVVGDFNGWHEDGLDLEDPDGDGVWTLEIGDLAPGRYGYRVLVDGERWIADPGADAQVDDGFGGRDSVRYVL